MAKFQMKPLIGAKGTTVRLGAGAGLANRVTDAEAGKLVKFVADSRYDLAAPGDAIEARVISVDTATTDDFSTGSVEQYVGGDNRFMTVVLDGLQATPGTGTVAAGDMVVVGSVVAKGTALPDPGPKVCKATDQAAAKAGKCAWRVVAVTKGTGTPGSVATIERLF